MEFLDKAKAEYESQGKNSTEINQKLISLRSRLSYDCPDQNFKELQESEPLGFKRACLSGAPTSRNTIPATIIYDKKVTIFSKSLFGK